MYMYTIINNNLVFNFYITEFLEITMHCRIDLIITLGVGLSLLLYSTILFNIIHTPTHLI